MINEQKKCTIGDSNITNCQPCLEVQQLMTLTLIAVTELPTIISVNAQDQPATTTTYHHYHHGMIVMI